jgi:hypothetical protein
MPLPVSTTSCLEKVQDRGSGGFGACGAKEEDKGNGRVSVFRLMLGTTVGKKTAGAAVQGSGVFSVRCKPLACLEWSGVTALFFVGSGVAAIHTYIYILIIIIIYINIRQSIFLLPMRCFFVFVLEPINLVSI